MRVIFVGIALVLAGFIIGTNAGIDEGKRKILKQAKQAGAGHYVLNNKNEMVWEWSEESK